MAIILNYHLIQLIVIIICRLPKVSLLGSLLMRQMHVVFDTSLIHALDINLLWEKLECETIIFIDRFCYNKKKLNLDKCCILI